MPRRPVFPLTDHPQFGVGVQLPVLVPRHALVHPRVRQGQAADGEHAINNLHSVLWGRMVQTTALPSASWSKGAAPLVIWGAINPEACR